ncbi:MAG: polysaccharide biosynthesis tyrosine autokinase [Leptolyngbya sp. UWPOB_LEPTO1]|uniref:GumC family protein n=1 Tax=Leptolyngbya sp. UWPOB_LEPTO1 TaxID=2815653 RepID=UPI001ACA83E0|nr:polysaccharide biosynthesis tyrosine autokinase [Leptolyngbya sp. UWPOB_LEPTO1]MBN8560358.1 polysaccharide biosynthesis tyrosine autokinase [Leptolyngbya sp. UWPOB_LEPTO1]
MFSSPDSSIVADTIGSPEKLNLQKYWLSVKRRWLPAFLVFSSLMGAATLYAIYRDPEYDASGKLLVKTDRKTSLSGIATESGRLEAITSKTDPLNTYAEILRSSPVIQATIDQLELTDKDGKPLKRKDFLKKMKVKPVVGADVLQVTYTDSSQDTAIAVVNQLIKYSIEANVAANRSETIAARKFVSEQLPIVENKVNQAEISLRQFKESNAVVDLVKESESMVMTLADLDRNISKSQVELSQANVRAAELSNQVGMNLQQALVATDLNSSRTVQVALLEAKQAEAALAKQQAMYREEHPSIHQLRRQQDAARETLQERMAEVVGSNAHVSQREVEVGGSRRDLVAELAEAEIERLSINSRLSALKEAQANYRFRAGAIPALEKRQRELERQLDAAQTTYKTLLTKLQEAQVAENQNVGNARIISPAEILPTKLTSRKAFLVAIVGLAGLILGIATALLTDYMDQSVKTLREARELFQYTLLGVIPTLDASRSLRGSTVPSIVGRDITTFAAQEAYRMLQANLKFLATSDQELKSIVITSSVRQEGKSAVAANLALAVSQVGKRVLLIDADLRYACQHHIWDLTNQFGLSNVIVGQTEVNDAIEAVLPNLDVLSAGTVPPNSLALLDSQRMRSLLDSFTQIYDFVILDTPALSGMADATVLNNMVDGSVLVVRPGTVSTMAGQAAKRYLQESGQKVLGMVVNHFNAAKEPDSYFYYMQDHSMSAVEKSRSAPQAS